MNLRQNTLAILNYENYDKFPVVHFGFWKELYKQWHEEGHLSDEEFASKTPETLTAKKLGFDYGWNASGSLNTYLLYGFEHREIEHTADGFVIYQNKEGLIEKVRGNAVSIPATIGTLMTGREAWREHYLPRFVLDEKRWGGAEKLASMKQRFEEMEIPAILHVGSLYGKIRNMLGVEELCYLAVDDFELYVEIIDTIGNLTVECVKKVFEAGVRPDVLHYWEDICYKNGPLVNPEVFEEYVAPYYRKAADIAAAHGTKLISLDCDGMIDSLVPIWVKNGVNIMFPIEVGTWGASIDKWRALYGREVLGVGGMNKLVLDASCDYRDIDAEIERLRRLAELGGYIPCPDHRLPLGTKWENVQYYCDKMKKVFQ